MLPPILSIAFRRLEEEGTFLPKPHSLPVEQDCEVLEGTLLVFEVVSTPKTCDSLPLSLYVESSLESCQMKAAKDNLKP